MTFHIHRIRTHAIYSKEDAVKYGLEKACIIYEIGNSCSGMKKSELYKEFPFIPRDRFNELLQEILDEGLLMEVKNDSK